MMSVAPCKNTHHLTHVILYMNTYVKRAEALNNLSVIIMHFVPPSCSDVLHMEAGDKVKEQQREDQHPLASSVVIDVTSSREKAFVSVDGTAVSAFTDMTRQLSDVWADMKVYYS